MYFYALFFINLHYLSLYLNCFKDCKLHLEIFCYICSEYIFKEQQYKVTELVKKSVFVLFWTKLCNQDKFWSPHKLCKPVVNFSIGG